MPIIRTNARLYFQNESSELPIVTGCVRTNGSSCAKTSDTTKRYFGTEHGSEIEMTPGALNIKGGSKQPLSISFDDNVGVTLTSPKKLILNADQDIIMKTPQSVKLKAQSQILVAKAETQNGFSLETDMHIKGSNVIKNGSDREAFAPFDDEPKAGTKPEPPAPPPEEKKGFDWGKLAIAAVVAVAVVASVLTFGLGATLAVAAVGAIVACAAVGVAEGAKNSIDSQLANNRGDTSKIDYGEVIKLGFFGAVTGATNMFKTEVCTVADWCAQTVLGTLMLVSKIMNPPSLQLATGNGTVISVANREAVALSGGNGLESLLGLGGIINKAETNSSGGNSGSKKVEYGEHYTKGKNGRKELKPNVEYTTQGGHTYSTDELGRITEADGTLNKNTAKRKPYDQKVAGREDRLPTDDGGHLVASIFYGSGELDNIVPMDATLNRGAWKAMENSWAKALKGNSAKNISPKTVDVKIKAIYSNNSARPSSFKVKYKIEGENWVTKKFQN